jgi:hypothetical protein
MTTAKLESDLGKAIQSLMNKAFEHQPRQTAGDGPDPWTHSVRCYVFGGGARNELYIDELWNRLQGLRIGISTLYWLPKPSEGFALPYDVDQFGRFAVAYGLSFHAANLEEVRLPSELQTFVEAYPDHGLPAIPPRFTPCTCYSNPDCVRCGGTGFLNH